MDIFLTVLEVVLLVGVSAVCSGLNVAFMSLNLSDLRRKAKLGNAYAKRLLPLRRNAHLTLAAILLTNVAAASAAPLVIENSLNGLAAAVISTLLLVVFAEIMPQALFVPRALNACGRLYPLLRAMIVVTYPIAKPLQLLLDRLFGPQKSELHTRHELGLIMNEHLKNESSELDEDEIEIMRGALQLSEKRVRDIMTPIEKTYWLTPDTLVTPELVIEIKRLGHSRVPVFNRKLRRGFGVLLVKDLLALDFAAKPLRIDELPLHGSDPVGSMTALDTMFRTFISAPSHLLPIEKNGHIVGIVTIEDLLEEILGHEIRDETDRSEPRQPTI